MDLNKSILKDVRQAVGLDVNTADFDTELLMHINSAIGTLNQVGVGKTLVVQNELQTWNDLRDVSQEAGNKVFPMTFSYISLSTKLIFDPPPPSAVEFQTRNLDQMLWRLKIAYETPYVNPPLLTED